MGGGPDPTKTNGAIKTVSMNSGETPDGQFFSQWNEKWDAETVPSFKTLFLAAEEERLRRALQIVESSVVSQEALIRSGRQSEQQKGAVEGEREKEAEQGEKGKEVKQGEKGKEVEPGEKGRREIHEKTVSGPQTSESSAITPGADEPNPSATQNKSSNHVTPGIEPGPRDPVHGVTPGPSDAHIEPQSPSRNGSNPGPSDVQIKPGPADQAAIRTEWSDLAELGKETARVMAERAREQAKLGSDWDDLNAGGENVDDYAQMVPPQPVRYLPPPNSGATTVTEHPTPDSPPQPNPLVSGHAPGPAPAHSGPPNAQTTMMATNKDPNPPGNVDANPERSDARDAAGTKRKGDDKGSAEEEGRGKRARKLTRELGDWIEAVREYLMVGVDCEEWRSCVQAWCLFENSTVVPGTKPRLGGTPHRPVINDQEAYAREWITWWNAMQPQARRADGEGAMPLPLTNEMKTAMACLRKAGSGGISTALVSLKWWWTPSEQDGRWKEAVIDMSNCFAMFNGGPD